MVIESSQYMSSKVARRLWAPRIVFEFAVKTCYVLDPWKRSYCPWRSSGVPENFWITPEQWSWFLCSV